MSVIAGIRAELADCRKRRAEVAVELAAANKEYTRSRIGFEHHHMDMIRLEDRIEALGAALRALGAQDTGQEDNQ